MISRNITHVITYNLNRRCQQTKQWVADSLNLAKWFRWTLLMLEEKNAANTAGVAGRYSKRRRGRTTPACVSALLFWENTAWVTWEHNSSSTLESYETTLICAGRSGSQWVREWGLNWIRHTKHWRIIRIILNSQRIHSELWWIHFTPCPWRHLPWYCSQRFIICLPPV